MAKELYDWVKCLPGRNSREDARLADSGGTVRQNRPSVPAGSGERPADRRRQVLVYVMAAGISYNNVWAGLGIPVNVIGARNKTGEPEDFHIGGSDASGIVCKSAGRDQRQVGDEVVMHCGQYCRDCAGSEGGDPMYSPTFRIWGYETNWGSFAQFTKSRPSNACPSQAIRTGKAASYTLVAATARACCTAGAPTPSEGDVALIWGGAGGLGSMAIQIVKAAGRPVAMVSGEDKFDYCMKLGAKAASTATNSTTGACCRTGRTMRLRQMDERRASLRRQIWEVLGEKAGAQPGVRASGRNHHSHLDLRLRNRRHGRGLRPAPPVTTPRSTCATYGCGKSPLQGSHFANTEQSNQMNELALRGLLDPLPIAGLRLRRNPGRSSTDVRKQVSSRQHGGAGRRD